MKDFNPHYIMSRGTSPPPSTLSPTPIFTDYFLVQLNSGASRLYSSLKMADHFVSNRNCQLVIASFAEDEVRIFIRYFIRRRRICARWLYIPPCWWFPAARSHAFSITNNLANLYENISHSSFDRTQPNRVPPLEALAHPLQTPG